MKYLVTGATGFIGSNLVKELEKDAETIFITGTDKEQRITSKKSNLVARELNEIPWKDLPEIDAVFHIAAINDTTFMDREEMFKVNFDYSKQIFQEAVKKGCTKIVYASTAAVYGNVEVPFMEKGPINPMNPYAESKYELDKFAMQFTKNNPKVTIVGLRYCNVYGPGEEHKGKSACIIYQIAQQMKNQNPKIFKYGEQKRDYIYINDVVRATILASKAKESCIVNCASGKSISFNELIEILNKVLSLKRKPEYIENPYKERYQSHTLCSTELAKEKINFVPAYSLEKGIEDYYKSGKLI